jgi:hypothetical protein
MPNGNGNRIALGYKDSSGNRSALECTNNTGGTFSTLYLMKSGGHVVTGGDVTALNGIASLATNSVTSAANFLGTTNTSGYAQVWNVSGTSGKIIFYNRSGNGGATVCGTALWTNTVASSGLDVIVGQNCGVAIISGVGVTGTGRAF